MARVTYVKAAHQRFKTVPVIDQETGQQKTTAVLRKNGEPKTTKKGKPIIRRLTIDDKTQPLPNRKCDKCGKEIEVGQPYKWIAPKSGPYGGSKRFRCGDCPAWNVWEYSYSLGARLAEISFNFGNEVNYEDAEPVRDALSSAAEAIRELASEKEEGADNIESGFGHETSQSEELREIADSLNSWADEIDQIEIPDYPEPEEQDCDECQSSGSIHNEETGEDEECEECSGGGTITPEEPTEDQANEWMEEVESLVGIVDESPV